MEKTFASDKDLSKIVITLTDGDKTKTLFVYSDSIESIERSLWALFGNGKTDYKGKRRGRPRREDAENCQPVAA